MIFPVNENPNRPFTSTNTDDASTGGRRVEESAARVHREIGHSRVKTIRSPRADLRAKRVLKAMDRRGESSPDFRKRGGKAIAALAMSTALIVVGGKGDEVVDIVRGTPDRIDNNLDYHNNPPKQEMPAPDNNLPAPIEQQVVPSVTVEP